MTPMDMEADRMPMLIEYFMLPISMVFADNQHHVHVF